MSILNRTVVDARPDSQSKTSGDRQRFIRRAKAQIKEAVKKAISTGDIKSLERGNIKVPVKDMNEPIFQNDPKSGKHKSVVTGNKDYIPGDHIDKPQGGSGAGGGSGSEDGEGQDEFSFILTPEEFYDFLFEDMALPDLMKKTMQQIVKVTRRRAGYVVTGNPSQLDIKQTYKFAYARHKALGRPSTEEITVLSESIHDGMTEDTRSEIMDRVLEMETRQKTIPLFDDIDLRYRNYPPKPEPITKAVMFCEMDVSGSMDEKRKDLGKRFFLLLYVWLMKQYDKNVEIVWIRHHTKAEEVDEETFFHSHESGGTVVSPIFDLTAKIIKERYSPADWNIYVCHASDGDNWTGDNVEVVKKLGLLLPSLQYFAYLQVVDQGGSSTDDNLWNAYLKVQNSSPSVNMVSATEPDQVWQVFKQLFTRDMAK